MHCPHGAVDFGRCGVCDWVGGVVLVAETGGSLRDGVLMTRTDIVVIWSMVTVIVILLCGALVSGIRAQTPPPTIVQTTYGYPAAFILFWQVGTSPPPPCGQTLPSGAPGPVLYSMAIQQGPPDTVMVCMNGTAGTPEWVPLVTAP